MAMSPTAQREVALWKVKEFATPFLIMLVMKRIIENENMNMVMRVISFSGISIILAPLYFVV